MVMSSALEVDVAKSRAAYQNFHADWEMRVNEEADLLRELQADLVFSNVGYLPLAGAQLAGIPNVALCSLNWADIYRHYCGAPSTPPLVLSAVEGSGRTADQTIARQILSGYAGADAFLRTTPGMPMMNLSNLMPINPIAAIGKNRRCEINHHLKLSGQEKLVLVSMGGFESRLPIEDWPRIDGVRYLVPLAWNARHPDAIALETIPMSFSDLLASVDVLLCKPGYGSFVEAACSGMPVLYVGRPDWPESPALIAWLQANAVCREVASAQQGQFAQLLEEIWNEAKPAPVEPTGSAQVADYLAEKLTGRRP